jgi:ribonuclease HIII
MNAKLSTLQAKLSSWHRDPSTPNIVDEIYATAFKGNFYQEIWDEPVLLALTEFIEANPPDPEFYGARVAEIAARANKVVAVNDLFFSILNPTPLTSAQSLESISARLDLDPKMMESCLRQIRESVSEPSRRVVQVVEEFVSRAPSIAMALRNCFDAYQSRQEIGMVYGLLVNNVAGIGVVLPVRAKAQSGTGRVESGVPTDESFVSAVSRARAALNSKGWLSTTQDIIFTVENTDATYTGSSISLPSLIAIYSSAREYQFDLFTAFTGNIDQRDNQWRIVRVEGIPQKLAAAKASGIRRVILPAQNKDDVPEDCVGLELIFADNIADAVSALTLPKIENAETIQQQKIIEVNLHCSTQGWQLSAAREIKDGLQFTITPATGNELTLTIYDTGTHSPKSHSKAEYQSLLQLLARFDAPETPIQSVQQTFNIKDRNLREQIRQQFEAMGPSEKRLEQHCDYSFTYENGREKLIVRQYSSGKLQIQGRAGPLYRKALDIIIPLYNLHFGNAALSISDFLSFVPELTETLEVTKVSEDGIEWPYIGTDESGKGDYFGPLVIAGVWVDKDLQNSLTKLGVRDSKQLSDGKCRELAAKIRELCPGKYHVVEIPPERYNQLHEQFLREKKNLNHLLAWGHARAIESLLGHQTCRQAIADQFGDEKYIASKLMEKGKSLKLLQTPKAERFIAVAAASVLARDLFLSRLNQLSADAGVALPKGASQAVIDAAKQISQKHGDSTLRKFAKLHFKTTASVRAGA